MKMTKRLQRREKMETILCIVVNKNTQSADFLTYEKFRVLSTAKILQAAHTLLHKG